MSRNPESPVEPFKRALANAVRSLAQNPDLEIVYSGEAPGVQGDRAVLPHPPRDLTPEDAARIRGMADQMALRMSQHDPAIHARTRPASAEGQPVFDALEQARIEAVGANALDGVKANLKALHDAAWARRPFNPVEAQTAPPMADILAMLLRERLTGVEPPANARPLVDMYRSEIEARGGETLEKLGEVLGDQRAFGRLARSLLRDLSMGDDLSDAPDPADQQEEDGDEGESESSEQGEEGEGEAQSPQQTSLDDGESTHRESDDADSQMTEAMEDPNAEDMDEPPEMGEGDQPARPEIKGEGKVPTYRVFTTAHDEVVAAEELVLSF